MNNDEAFGNGTCQRKKESERERESQERKGSESVSREMSYND